MASKNNDTAVIENNLVSSTNKLHTMTMQKENKQSNLTTTITTTTTINKSKSITKTNNNNNNNNISSNISPDDSFENILNPILSNLDVLELTVGPDKTYLNDYSLFQHIDNKTKVNVLQSITKNKRLDRAVGSLVGCAIGDYVGAPLEFLDAVDEPGSTGYVFTFCPEQKGKELVYTDEENRFRLKIGQWTDDCSMALCMADSLIIHKGFNGSDIRVRFYNWWFSGYNNAFRKDPTRSSSVGLGGNISASIYSMEPGSKPSPRFERKSEDSGNGSLMRLAPIPVFFSSDWQQTCTFAKESSLTTHPGAIAAEACAFMSFVIFEAINYPGKIKVKEFLNQVSKKYIELLKEKIGEPGVEELWQLLTKKRKNGTEKNWNWRSSSLEIERVLKLRGKQYNGYPVSSGYFGAYCMDGLAMALWSVYHTTCYEDAIQKCVNLLGDADSTGAIAGQIAGSIYGYTAIPKPFINHLRQWDDDEIALRAYLLFTIGEKIVGEKKKKKRKSMINENKGVKEMEEMEEMEEDVMKEEVMDALRELSGDTIVNQSNRPDAQHQDGKKKFMKKRKSKTNTQEKCISVDRDKNEIVDDPTIVIDRLLTKKKKNGTLMET